MFSEKEHKDYRRQILMKLERKKDGLLSPWQISNLISKISSYYYKSELINTISLAIINGISPKNIFIMNDSFNINNSYCYVGTFNLKETDDVKNLYHLGFPVTIFPEKSIMNLKLCFELFSKYFTYLNSHNLGKLDKNSLLNIVTDVLTTSDVTIEFALIKKLAIAKLNSANDHGIDKKTLLLGIEKLHNTYTKLHQKYLDDEYYIDKFINSYNNNTINIDLKNDSKLQHVEKSYFGNFFEIFSELKRPIVGIYYPETKQIQILCHNFINKNARDSKFIDLKEVKHNSPYIIEILIGIGICAPLIKAAQSMMDSNNLQKQETQIEMDEKESEKELQSALALLEEIEEAPEIKAITNVVNDYLKHKMLDTQKTNNEKFKEPINQYGFNNLRLEVKFITEK